MARAAKARGREPIAPAKPEPAPVVQLHAPREHLALVEAIQEPETTEPLETLAAPDFRAVLNAGVRSAHQTGNHRDAAALERLETVIEEVRIALADALPVTPDGDLRDSLSTLAELI